MLRRLDGMQPGKLALGVTKLGAHFVHLGIEAVTHWLKFAVRALLGQQIAAAPKGSASARATRPSKYVPRP
jgi:hypothetical protein